MQLDKLFDWLLRTRRGNKIVEEAATELAALRAENAELREALKLAILREQGRDWTQADKADMIAAIAILTKSERTADDILKREG